MDISFKIIKKGQRFSHQLIKQVTRLLILVLFSFGTQADTPLKYQLSQVASLQHDQLSSPLWHSLIANPSDKDQLYIADNQGRIFLVEDGQIQVPAFLNITESLPLISGLQTIAPNSPSTKLTAFVLHPDFSLKDQTGYATFYTAHTEKKSSSSKTKRLQVRQPNVEYAYDSVLTEWKFSPIKTDTLKIASQREVLRVSLVNAESGIKQLAFNPFQKSWNDHYGLLHLVLSEETTLKQFPLYSGALLRLNPHSFGRKSYTVPLDNPYIKDDSIHNEILVLGAQNIQQFIWPKKNSDQLLLSHLYNNQSLLSFSEMRNDWRNKTAIEAQPFDKAGVSFLLYKGRDLPALFKQLIYLSHDNAHWQLNALTFAKEGKIETNNEGVLDKNILSPQHELKIFESQDNEILLLDIANSLIYQLSQKDVLSQSQIQADQNKTNYLLIIVLIISLIIIGLMVVKTNKSKKSLAALVKRSFAYFEVSQNKQTVALYSRHKTMTEINLSLTAITASQIKLNDQEICAISTKAGEGFNEEKEESLRHYFSQEYIDKMVDNKIRQVHLILRDQTHSYPISVYARRGNKRLTQKRYKDVMEELIDWCWLISNTINKSETGTRKPRVALKSTVKAVKRVKAENTETIRKVSLINTQTQQTDLSDKTVVDKSTVPSEITTSQTKIDESNTRDDRHRQEGIIDTELVNALEKLVKLKQQGFLTEEEFNQAKEKLLKTLIK